MCLFSKTKTPIFDDNPFLLRFLTSPLETIIWTKCPPILTKKYKVMGSDVAENCLSLEELNQKLLSMAENDWWAHFKWLLKRDYELL